MDHSQPALGQELSSSLLLESSCFPNIFPLAKAHCSFQQKELFRKGCFTQRELKNANAALSHEDECAVEGCASPMSGLGV